MTTPVSQRSDQVSTARLYVLRIGFFLMFIGLGFLNWRVLLDPTQPLGATEGVPYSVWAALSTVSLLGIRYPLRMIPVLIFQLTYKTIWVATVALPLWTAGALEWDLLTFSMVGGIAFDLVAIPWPYVLSNYVRRPAEPLRGGVLHPLSVQPRAA